MYMYMLTCGGVLEFAVNVYYLSPQPPYLLSKIKMLRRKQNCVKYVYRYISNKSKSISCKKNKGIVIC